MTISKLDKLKAQRDELDKKIREVAAKKSQAERDLDTRRKTIIGGWVMKHRPQLVRELLANGLEREQDKAALAGWTPPEPEKKPAAPAPAPAAAPQVKKEG
jgi:hypothetical protein